MNTDTLLAVKPSVDAGFLHRDCPCCRSARRKLEVFSDTCAEEMELDALRPYWAGIRMERRIFSYHRCSDCGLLYAPVFFNDGQLQELYSELAPNMEEETGGEAIAATQHSYFEAVVRNRVPLDGDYLEVGPDVGHVTRIAAQSGRFDRFWLFEPNLAVHAELAEATLSKPHTISAGMTDLSAVPDSSVGLAVMIQVLDHLNYPLEMLAQVRSKLRPGGVLLIVTHNERSALRHAMRLRWPPFCLQHPEIYNPDSINRLLSNAGFARVKVSRSVNHFPVDFMAKQAAMAVGLKLERVPLPRFSLGLKLGNMLTLAWKSNPA